METSIDTTNNKVRKNRFSWLKRNNNNHHQLSQEKSQASGNDHKNQKKRYTTFKEAADNISASGLEEYGSKFLSLLSRKNEILQASLFIKENNESSGILRFACGYACNNEMVQDLKFKPGEGLPGQVFNDKELLNLKNFSEGYIKIKTALGEASPKSLILVPLISKGESIGVIELASFNDFSEEDEAFFLKVSEEILSEIIANYLKAKDNY